MTRQIRTWHEREAAAGEPGRWDVSINGVPVPGGYIEQTGEAAFEVHYPHLDTKTVDSLDTAKRRIELAPPITREGMALGKPLAEPREEDLLSPDEAAALLGVSRYRVNAMAASGVLAGTRRDGRTLVSRASVEARSSRLGSGPAGRFANAFLCYRPEGGEGAWTMAEVDADDASALEEAKRFIVSVTDGDSPGSVEVLSYREAMALCARARRGQERGSAQPVSLSELAAMRLQDPLPA